MEALAVLFVVPAAEPVPVSVRFPFLALLVTATLSVPVLPKGTGFIPVMLGVIPVVPALAPRVPASLNPPIGLMVTVYVTVLVPLDGRATDCELGLIVKLNVGG